MKETSLILEGAELPPFSSRSCIQTLEPIKSSKIMRTVDGNLIYLGEPSYEKYKSTIIGEDKNALALNQLWRGKILKVSCIAELWHSTHKASQEYKLIKEAVEGSIYALDINRKNVEISTEQGIVKWDATNIEGDVIFIAYKPIIYAMVIDFNIHATERLLKTKWELSLEEV